MEYFTHYAEDKSPKEIGLKAAKGFDAHNPFNIKGNLQKSAEEGYQPYEFHYATACTWSGAMNMAGLTDNQPLLHSLVSKYTNNRETFDNYINTYIYSGSGNVDDNVFGIVPGEVYLQTGDKEARKVCLGLADHQIDNLKHQKRKAIDDMFMIPGLQLQAYRISGFDKYLNAAAKTMEEYLNNLQQDDGCFFQLNNKGDTKVKWGRGNGWFAVGMAKMLGALDPGHHAYANILEGYKKMMSGLLAYQIKSGPGAGLWKQVIDCPDNRNWPETSGSAMFAYAMIQGVKNSILPGPTYGAPARSAWDGLTGYVQQDGSLKDISRWCYPGQDETDPIGYYVNRAKEVGNLHGQAPLLWCAAELMR